MPPYIITNIKATRPLVPSNDLKLNETKATETADTVTGQLLIPFRILGILWMNVRNFKTGTSQWIMLQFIQQRE